MAAAAPSGAGSVASAGAAIGSKSSAGATAEEETVELLLPVNDAGGGLATGAASAAAFLSLSVSAAASHALLRDLFCPYKGMERYSVFIGFIAPFRHPQSVSVLDTQTFSFRMLINKHTNAT